MHLIPRVILSGLSGGAGKTILSLGLARLWTEQGIKIKPFKKGPDYIDAVWLARAAEESCTNLDPFLMSDEQIQNLFFDKANPFDLSLIEGNRGLYDGKDIDGSCSTAHLARLLFSPVVVIVDCTKMTRTAAAVLKGIESFERGLNICGVVLNRTAGPRHRKILCQCIEEYTSLKVFGSLPKVREELIPERHMGLISDREYEAGKAIDNLARVVSEWIDWKEILAFARQAVPFAPPASQILGPDRVVETSPAIGVVRDTSLWFYYPENLEALEKAGARLIEVSLLEDKSWPELHGLYLGGGFPETQAQGLSANVKVRDLVFRLVADGLPIYAECGGLMYLCQDLAYQGDVYPMVGVFPVRTSIHERPQGHGYTLSKVLTENPFFSPGISFSGHEFHYSQCECAQAGKDFKRCLQMVRGVGMGQKQDGLLYKNTFACYTHLHALTWPKWAENFVRAAQTYQQCRENGRLPCPAIVARG